MFVIKFWYTCCIWVKRQGALKEDIVVGLNVSKSKATCVLAQLDFMICPKNEKNCLFGQPFQFLIRFTVIVYAFVSLA